MGVFFEFEMRVVQIYPSGSVALKFVDEDYDELYGWFHIDKGVKEIEEWEEIKNYNEAIIVQFKTI